MAEWEPVFCELCLGLVGMTAKGAEQPKTYCTHCMSQLLNVQSILEPDREDILALYWLQWRRHEISHVRGSTALHIDTTHWMREVVGNEKKVSSVSLLGLTLETALDMVKPATAAGARLLAMIKERKKCSQSKT